MDFFVALFQSETLQSVVMYVVVAIFVIFGGQIKSAMVANIHMQKNKLAAEVLERVGATTASQLMLIVDAVERYAADVLKEYTSEDKLNLALKWAQDKGLKVTQADIEIALTAIKKWYAKEEAAK